MSKRRSPITGKMIWYSAQTMKNVGDAQNCVDYGEEVENYASQYLVNGHIPDLKLFDYEKLKDFGNCHIRQEEEIGKNKVVIPYTCNPATNKGMFESVLTYITSTFKDVPNDKIDKIRRLISSKNDFIAKMDIKKDDPQTFSTTIYKEIATVLLKQSMKNGGKVLKMQIDGVEGDHFLLFNEYSIRSSCKFLDIFDSRLEPFKVYTLKINNPITCFVDNASCNV